MKKNKPCGPDCLTIEALGDGGAIWMTGVLNEAMREGISEEWRTSTTRAVLRLVWPSILLQYARGRVATAAETVTT